MIKRNVVHDGNARLEKDERAVALVDFTDENLAVADSRAGKRRARADEVAHIRAVHDGWVPSGAVKNPAEHADCRGLAACASDADGQPGRVEKVSKKLRARRHGGTNATRGLHVGHRLLDGSRRHQGLIAWVEAVAIRRMQQHAARTKKIESFGIASLVKRRVGALTPPALRLNNQSERSHAATANAAEKVISELRHWRNLEG